MRWGLIGVRLFVISVDLVILILILLSILPLVQGDISVEIPESSTAPTFNNGILSFSQSIEISNGGFFDIQQFSVSLLMTDKGLVVADEKTMPQDIPAGKTSSVNVQFDIDLNELSDDAKRSLVFNSTSLDTSIGFQATYTLGLVKMDLRGNQTMLNEPMISNIYLNPNATDFVDNGTTTDIVIPYSFSAGPLIQGQPLSVRADVTNATASLGNSTQNIFVSANNNGQLVITMDPQAAAWLETHSEELDFAITFEFYGATFTSTYHYSSQVGGA